ncbi:MAG: trypsin-like serine protease [Deltaproteobacteria bacterium]|nr:trypsin-like serine protease [Deltaproteobacteria bacterium]
MRHNNLFFLIVILILAVGCDDDSNQSTNNTTNNTTNNITNNVVNNNNTNLTCEDPMDTKELPWAKNLKIYNGITENSMCMTDAQKMAVGAILSSESGWSNVCSGTLITDIHVLTAAHCASDYNGSAISPSELRFAFGDDMEDPDGVFTVTSVKVNPDYSYWGTTTGTDHAVLTLSESPLDSLDIEPIPVNFEDISFLKDKYVQQVGFGITEDNYDNTLKWWTPELVSSFASSEGDMVVDGQGESSVCSGDSGGPSLYHMEGNIVSVVGTVSWGDQSCVDNDHYAMTNWDDDWLSANIPDYDYCGDIDEAGFCDGNIARWCENGKLRTECCDDVTGGCGENSSGNFRCESPRDECELALPYAGVCGTYGVTWCWFGKKHYRSCEACNQTCGATGVTGVGNYCL